MKYILIIFLLVIVSCSSAPTPKLSQDIVKEDNETKQAERDRHLGYWIGETTTRDGKFLRWLVERRVDGSFTLTHIIRNSPDDPTKFDPEKAFFEIGIWGIAGDIYFTATRQYFENGKVANYDVTRSSLYDAYRIKSFDGETFTYQDIETGNVYSVKKAPKGKQIDI